MSPLQWSQTRQMRWFIVSNVVLEAKLHDLLFWVGDVDHGLQHVSSFVDDTTIVHRLTTESLLRPWLSAPTDLPIPPSAPDCRG